jgi:hypothetical protein
MNIPGFTAEGSLYTSSARYNMTAIRFLAAKADIQPQLPRMCAVLGVLIRTRYLQYGNAVAQNNWSAALGYLEDIHAAQEKYSEVCR